MNRYHRYEPIKSNQQVHVDPHVEPKTTTRQCDDLRFCVLSPLIFIRCLRNNRANSGDVRGQSIKPTGIPISSTK